MHVVEAMTGGVRRFVLDCASLLGRDRFAQHVVLSLRRDRYGPEDVAALREMLVDVTVVDMVRRIWPPADLRALLRIKRSIDIWRPDIVHGHSSKGGFLARLAARLTPPDRRPKTVYTPHCFAFSARLDPARRALYTALERLAAGWTDHFVFVSLGEAHAARSAGINIYGRWSLVPLPVDASRLQAWARPCRADLGLPEGFLFLSVGRLVPQKNHALLLRAFARAFGGRDDVYLGLAGDGPLEPALRRLATRLGIDRAVLFLGYRDDVPRLLAAVDAFALASAWEAMPYALLEAMAVGLPVVVPDLPGLADAVAEAGAGVVFQPCSATALAAALAAVVQASDVERSRWGCAGRQMVRERHSPGTFAAQLADVYLKLAG